MIDPVTASTNATASAQERSLTGSMQKMGKSDFLKLLVAQLKNQDPLKPQDNAQFVAELAQFSNLEQTIGINERLDNLSMQSQGLQNSNIVAMVGARATVKGSTVTASGSGLPVPVRFELASAASNVSIKIADLQGNEIRTIQVGSRPGGAVDLQWDGRNNNGLVQPAGPYTVNVIAKNESGASVGVTQSTTGVVRSVSFDKGYPVLTLDSGVAVPVADLLSVSR